MKKYQSNLDQSNSNNEAELHSLLFTLSHVGKTELFLELLHKLSVLEKTFYKTDTGKT